MLKLKTKKCRICSKDFAPTNSIQAVCGFECAKVNKKQVNKDYKQKRYEELWYNKTTVYNYKCSICSKDYTTVNKRQKHCSRKCFFEEQKIKRLWDWNPAYRNWAYSYKSKDKKELRKVTLWYWEKLFARNSKKLRDAQIEKAWYYYCEHCWTNNSKRRETHHIIFRSEAPFHKSLHEINNLIRICIICHNEFHKHKEKRNMYIVNRRLRVLFPEYIKKDHYLTETDIKWSNKLQDSNKK